MLLFLHQTRWPKPVHSVANMKYTGCERCVSQRFPVNISVPVVPVDEAYNTIGDLFMLTIRNISARGVDLVHNHPIKSKFLALELPGRENQTPTELVIKVLRCQPIGSVYEIAGRFVMRATD